MVLGLILLLGIAIQCRGASNVDVMSALQDIYTALDGPGWKWAFIDPSQREWNFTMNNGQYVDIDQACDWAGIACNDSRVLGISSINSLVLSGGPYRDVNLRGTLPSTVFSHLTTLEVLKLGSSGLSGTKNATNSVLGPTSRMSSKTGSPVGPLVPITLISSLQTRE